MIYFLYGVSGPIKTLFIDAVKSCFKDDKLIDTFNCMGTTQTTREYDSTYELKFFSTKQEMDSDSNYSNEYAYKEQSMESLQVIEFRINTKQLDQCNENNIPHFIICHDIDTIENIIKTYDDTAFSLLGVDFVDLKSVLSTICSKYKYEDNITTRHEKIDRLERDLNPRRLTDKYNNLVYQAIQIKFDECSYIYPKLVETLCDLVRPIVDKNAPYYYWGRLLNTERIFGDDDDVLPEALNAQFAFTLDYKKVIRSAPYRRLQDKAQVFSLEKQDYPRTRLTHSGECSAIAEELGVRVVKIIRSKYDENPALPYVERCEDIPVLLRTAALLHDMGNPPFGHFGEECIRIWFANNNLGQKFDKLKDAFKNDFIYYDGNAQLFRLLTSLDETERRFNLTYALLAVIIKYHTPSKDLKNMPKKKLGYFSSEQKSYNEVQQKVGLEGCRHPLTCILEAADDIANLTSDLEDAYKKKIITINQITQSFSDNKCLDIVTKLETYLEKKCFDNEDEDNLRAICKLRNYIQSQLAEYVAKSFEENYEKIMKRGNFFGENLISCNEESNNIKNALEKLLTNYVYNNREVVFPEIKASKIINDLLDTFVPATISIDDSPSKIHEKLQIVCSNNYKKIYDTQKSKTTNDDEQLYYKILLALDNICGMTDEYAADMHNKISAK
jgi:dGTPase